MRGERDAISASLKGEWWVIFSFRQVGSDSGHATMGPPPPNRRHRPERTERHGRDSVSDDGLVDLPATEEWRPLVTHFDGIRDRHLRQLFAEDPRCGSPVAVGAGGC